MLARRCDNHTKRAFSARDLSRRALSHPRDSGNPRRLARERAVSDRLFDVADKERRRLAGNLPVPVDTSEACPECGAPLIDTSMTEQALFIHGGYGANRESVSVACAEFCGWGLTRSVTETNPRRR